MYAISQIPDDANWGTGWRETLLCASGAPLTLLLMMRLADWVFRDYKGNLRSKGWLRGDTIFADDAEAVNALLRKETPPNPESMPPLHAMAFGDR